MPFIQITHERVFACRLLENERVRWTFQSTHFIHTLCLYYQYLYIIKVF